MKFYRDKYPYVFWYKVTVNELTAIYYNSYYIQFFKNGIYHNSKNASYVNLSEKQFYLNGKYYSNQTKFTKQSWRRFVKLQAFL